MARLLSLFAGLFAAVVVASCGGGEGSGTPPGEYASQVCGAITSYKDQLEETGQRLGRGATDAASVKAQIVEFIDEAVTLTNTLIGEVEDAGPPAVEEGEALQNELEQSLDKVKASFEQAKETAQGLPTDDPTAFQQAATQLGETLERQGSDIGTSLDQVNERFRGSNELGEAFDKDPACKKLS